MRSIFLDIVAASELDDAIAELVRRRFVDEIHRGAKANASRRQARNGPTVVQAAIRPMSDFLLPERYPDKDENGLPEGKPLKCLVAGPALFRIIAQATFPVGRWSNRDSCGCSVTWWSIAGSNE
jgi:hypothetical protein